MFGSPTGTTVLPKSPTVFQMKLLFSPGIFCLTGYWAARIERSAKETLWRVIGAGPAGLCTMMCARLYDPGKIIVLDTDENRLKVAKENHLADFCINPGKISEKDLEAQIRELSYGRGADRVFEVAGGKDTFQTAWKIARPNAVVTLVAMYEEDQRLPLPSMYGKNLVFKTGGVDGCYCEQIMELIQKGKLDTNPLITHRTTLGAYYGGLMRFLKRNRTA